MIFFPCISQYVGRDLVFTRDLARIFDLKKSDIKKLKNLTEYTNNYRLIVYYSESIHRKK